MGKPGWCARGGGRGPRWLKYKLPGGAGRGWGVLKVRIPTVLPKARDYNNPRLRTLCTWHSFVLKHWRGQLLPGGNTGSSGRGGGVSTWRTGGWQEASDWWPHSDWCSCFWRENPHHLLLIRCQSRPWVTWTRPLNVCWGPPGRCCVRISGQERGSSWRLEASRVAQRPDCSKITPWEHVVPLPRTQSRGQAPRRGPAGEARVAGVPSPWSLQAGRGSFWGDSTGRGSWWRGGQSRTVRAGEPVFTPAPWGSPWLRCQWEGQNTLPSWSLQSSGGRDSNTQN